MIKTIGTLFSGGGGVDIGAMMAGLTPLWGVEYDAQIAEWYQHNIGDHVTVANLFDVMPQSFPRVDVLHASPPCPNFSVAKAGGEETEQDRALAEKVAEFIEVVCPEIFTLENVMAYEKSQSWQFIYNTLLQLGYGVRWWVLNSANYGVPQTRKRMIVIARRDGILPQRPQPTHEKTPSGLFALKPWVGWYEAIEDLIETLPRRRLARYLLRNIGKNHEALLIDGSNASPPITTRLRHEPFFTIAAMPASKHPHVAIINNVTRFITIDCRKRAQSFPDWYELPGRTALASRIIGNAAPPLLYQRVIEGLL